MEVASHNRSKKIILAWKPPILKNQRPKALTIHESQLMTALLRSLSIWWHSCKLRLDLLLPANRPFWLHILFLPAKFFSVKGISDGARIRLWCEQLGPIFIKFGQLLSTRPDLLTDEMASELKKLQDAVPAFDNTLFRELVEQGLGGKIEDLFAEYEAEPMASASLAQVHGAKLHNGEEVVIKVIRPGIKQTIQSDIKLLKLLASIINNMGADGRRLHAPEVIADYQFIIENELDLRHEAANAQKLHDNFDNTHASNPANYTPKVYWDYVRENIMVSERIDGIPVIDAQAITDAGIELRKLAEIGVGIFFTQVFEHNFFHADMHPGNIFVNKRLTENPQYMCVDCAIVGSLTEEERYSLATMLLGVFKRDYRRVAEVQIQYGWVAADTPVHQFEAEIRTVCEPIFARPLSEISFADILVNLFRTARRFDMQMIPSLFLLEKTIVNIEGLGRQLYPELDLWSTLAPHLEKWSKERYSPKTLFKSFKENAPDWIEQFPTVPPLIFKALQQLANPQTVEVASKPKQKSSSAALWLAALAGASLGLLLPELPSQAGLKDLSIATLALIGAYVLIKRH